MAETMSQLFCILNSWELLADTGKTTMMHRVPTTTVLVPEAFLCRCLASSLKADFSTGPGRGPCIVLLVRCLVTGNARPRGHMSEQLLNSHAQWT